MSENKVSWDDIPSLDDLKVDWDYEPENPLGKRAYERMKNTELYPVLDVSTIKTTVVSDGYDEDGFLLDLTPAGIAISLGVKLEVKQPVKIGLFLGRQKIVSKAIVRHVTAAHGKYKIGMEFISLPKDCSEFITGIFASKISEF